MSNTKDQKSEPKLLIVTQYIEKKRELRTRFADLWYYEYLAVVDSSKSYLNGCYTEWTELQFIQYSQFYFQYSFETQSSARKQLNNLNTKKKRKTSLTMNVLQSMKKQPKMRLHCFPSFFLFAQKYITSTFWKWCVIWIMNK